MLASTSIGKTVMVEVIRMGQKQNLRVSIEELSEDIEPLVAEEVRMELGMVLKFPCPELQEKLCAD